MELVILGSGTAVPSAKRGPSGLVILIEDEPILFDSGPGTLQRMARAGIDCRRLERVFYTHLHPDHTSELIGLLFLFRNPDYRRSSRLTVTGPKGFAEFYRKLVDTYGRWVEADGYELKIEETLDGEVDGGCCSVVSREVLHAQHSVGYRVEDGRGRVITYSGDTAYCEGIVELGLEADILVLECSFPDGVKTDDHLTPSMRGG
jgi:ribonuclease BN (tRNA processing enzyme)